MLGSRTGEGDWSTVLMMGDGLELMVEGRRGVVLDPPLESKAKMSGRKFRGDFMSRML